MPFRGLAVKDPKAVVIGDVNSDGRDDLVIATQTGIYQSAVYKLFVYLQTPEGQLSPPVQYPAGNSVSLAIADVNSDGRADLLCSTKKGFAVLLQEESGTLAAPVEYISSLSEAEGGALLVADLTNDGRPDVAVVMSGPNVSSSIEIFQQTPDHTLVSFARYPGGGYSLIGGDFNSDGLVDILSSSIRGFTVQRQLPGGGLAAPDVYNYPSGTTVMSAAAGDVNGDGRDDVIVNQSASFLTIGVWLQDSSGTLRRGPDYRAYQGATNMETGDFNGEGRTDVAVLNGSWQGLSLYSQKEDGSLADREIYPGPYTQTVFEKHLATGDLNGDGQRDAVVLNPTGAFVFYHAPKNGDRITTLASFDGLFASQTGSSPLGALTPDQKGNFYGVSPDSGANSFGACFRVTPDGLLTAIGKLGPGTGAHPVGGLVQGNDGNFYGSTTVNSGGAHHGTLFKMTPTGALTTLVQFDGTNGSVPLASLTKASDGNFYGTTSAGGLSDSGVIFRLTPAGVFTVLHHFDGIAGREPRGRLTQGRDGLLYGTTRQGGTSGWGTVFNISVNGAFTPIASFDGSNGALPYAEMIEGLDGTFYGTASEGGENGFGTIFTLQQGTLQAVYSFSPATGVYPESGLTLADGGNFYGTASQGGEGGYGTVFKFAPSGSLTVLTAFGFWNGAFPTSTPVADSGGNLYGTTAEGGLFGDGSIYRLALHNATADKQTITPANLSTRGYVGTGDSVLIGGYIIGGTTSKQVIMRAIGPSLTSSGISDALADPMLALYDAQGNKIAENDNWRTGEDAGVVATTLPPQNDREAAIAKRLQPGAYTAVVRGVNGGTGVGLVEIYDLEPQSASKLLNLSSRVEASTGPRALIGGFIVPPGPPARILVRAVGPSLANVGFPYPKYLDRPKVELHNATGNVIASSKEWVHSPQKRQIAETGLAPMDDWEPAIVLTVPPGNYTAVVESTLFKAGIGLVEIYALDY
ncbi:MAG: hypothetical protein QOD12_2233 [Verrucomicrobiota bacterium]|jgi:uncharacterized repeat protein (TIGR03803 family)